MLPATPVDGEDEAGAEGLQSVDACMLWRRKATASAFSTANMKAEFPNIRLACSQLIEVLKTVGPDEVVDMDSALCRESLDVIGEPAPPAFWSSRSFLEASTIPCAKAQRRHCMCTRTARFSRLSSMPGNFHTELTATAEDIMMGIPSMPDYQHVSIASSILRGMCQLKSDRSAAEPESLRQW